MAVRVTRLLISVTRYLVRVCGCHALLVINYYVHARIITYVTCRHRKDYEFLQKITTETETQGTEKTSIAIVS